MGKPDRIRSDQIKSNQLISNQLLPFRVQLLGQEARVGELIELANKGSGVYEQSWNIIMIIIIIIQSDSIKFNKTWLALRVRAEFNQFARSNSLPPSDKQKRSKPITTVSEIESLFAQADLIDKRPAWVLVAAAALVRLQLVAPRKVDEDIKMALS